MSAFLCGPNRPTPEDLRIVAQFERWLRGEHIDGWPDLPDPASAQPTEGPAE